MTRFRDKIQILLNFDGFLPGRMAFYTPDPLRFGGVGGPTGPCRALFYAVMTA
jgi:hypothetical protein